MSAMSKLRIKPSGSHGRIHHVTPERAGWTYVGFDVHVLAPGETAAGETGDREVPLTLRLDTRAEIGYVKRGGILPFVLDTLG